MELGPIQKQWLADLRANPERQVKGTLGGIMKTGKINMCCLGQFVVTKNTIEDPNYKIPKNICVTSRDGEHSFDNIDYVWEDYGLYDPNGKFINDYSDHKGVYNTLTEMNDKGISWPEIADFIEANPENVFTRSL